MPGRILIAVLLFFTADANAQKYRYTMQADVSLLIADGVIPVSGFQIFNGIKLDKWSLEPGITVGADIYQQFILMPVSVGFKWMPFPGKAAVPYIGLNAGYGLTWLERSTAEKSYRGGGMFNPIIGLRIKTRSRTTLNFGAGFKQQKATTIEKATDGLGRPEWESSETYKFSRMSVSVGVGF